MDLKLVRQLFGVMNPLNKGLRLYLLTLVSMSMGAPLFGQTTWTEIDKGLSVTEIMSPITSEFGTNLITVLRIDPAQFEFVMVNTSAGDSMKRTMAGWCKEKKLLGGVNAGMFRLTDQLTNTGYMKNYEHINNPKLTGGNYKLVLALNPKKKSLPAVQIIDLECENWATVKTQYNTYVQGLRIIDCHRKVTWAKSAKKWSMVLWGIDKQGNVLWIFTRSPLPVTTFASVLLTLDIGLERLMYLEGGPEASLLLNHPDKRILLMGSYETGFNENDFNEVLWTLPNVIGIRKKESP